MSLFAIPSVAKYTKLFIIIDPARLRIYRKNSNLQVFFYVEVLNFFTTARVKKISRFIIEPKQVLFIKVELFNLTFGARTVQ